jgi:hypothetical protein
VEARQWIKPLNAGARIAVETEGRPIVRYVVRLEVAHESDWQTIHLFDNAHGRHDEHRYADGVKLAATEFMAGTVEKVLPSAIELLSARFQRIIEDWRKRSDD